LKFWSFRICMQCCRRKTSKRPGTSSGCSVELGKGW